MHTWYVANALQQSLLIGSAVHSRGSDTSIRLVIAQVEERFKKNERMHVLSFNIVALIATLARCMNYGNVHHISCCIDRFLGYPFLGNIFVLF